MSHTLKGYLRDNPGGTAVSGKTVSLLDVNTGIAPVTNAYTNLSGSSSVTDANGMWSFTMDLGTGPLKISADLGGGNIRYRSNDETFQYEGLFISSLPYALQAFQPGVIKSAWSEFNCTAGAVRTLPIQPGAAIIKGFPYGWESGNKTLTGNTNGSVGTTRHDFVCLRQWYNGTSEGKQDLVLIEGGSSTDPVATTVEGVLTAFIQGANIWDLPIWRAKLANGSTVYTLEDLRGSDTYPWAMPYIDRVPNTVTFGNDIVVTDDITSEDITATDLTTTARLAVTGVSSMADTLTFSGGKGHLYTGSNPTTAYGAGAGSGGSLAKGIEGGDKQGKVFVTTGSSGVAAGILLRVTFATALSTANYTVKLWNADADSADVRAYVDYSTLTTTYFEISCRVTPANNTSHHWFYEVAQYTP